MSLIIKRDMKACENECKQSKCECLMVADVYLT